MLSADQFYSAFSKAGMLKTVTWSPSSGGPQQTAQVRYKAPTESPLGGEAFSTDYTIKYPATQLAGLKRGEVLAIDGQQYTVREGPKSELDGSVLEAKLRRGT